MIVFRLKWYQVAFGIAMSSLYTLSQDINGGFSLNEIVLNVYSGYDDPENTDLKYVRLGVMLTGNVVMAIPSIWLGLTAYRNRILELKTDFEQLYHVTHTFMQRVQKIILLTIASIYGFVAALNMVYGLADLSAEEVHPALIYFPAIAVGLMFGWGFNHIHSHAVEESSNQQGIFSKNFLTTLKRRFWTNRDRQRTIIALASVGEFYFILREFFQQLSRNPDLKDHFDANQVWYISGSIFGSLFGLIEANTEIAGMENQHEENTQGLVVNPYISKLAYSAGLMNSIDHATGITKLIKDIAWLITFIAASDTAWVDRDDPVTCTVRGLIWLVAAGLFLNANARGFQAMLLAAHTRYFREIAITDASVNTPLLLNPAEFGDRGLEMS